MSYILDALRRAESERDRERGVPGLNAQPVPAGSLLGLPSRRNRVWIWIVLGLGVGLAVPMAWRWLAADEAPTPDTRAAVTGHVATPAPAVAPAPPAAVAPAVQPAAETAVAPSTTPGSAAAAAPTTSSAATTKPAATAPAARPSGPTPQVAARARRADAPASAPAARPAAVARPTPPAPRKPARTEAGTAPAAAAAPPLPRMSDLPEDLRRQVPTLTFGGSVHSPMPAQRMVIFNGQVLREGDTVAEGLTVEEIRAKSAVLRIRGQRFEIVF